MSDDGASSDQVEVRIGHRAAVMVALQQAVAQAIECRRLLGRFYTLGDGGQAQARADLDERLGDDGVAAGLGDAVDERLVYLEGVHGHGLQESERRVPGPEVVER